MGFGSFSVCGETVNRMRYLQQVSLLCGKPISKNPRWRNIWLRPRKHSCLRASHHIVSQDLKTRIPDLFYTQQYDVVTICKILDVRKSLVYETLKNYRQFGTSYNPNRRQHSRPRMFNSINISFIKALLAQQHCIYLDEIQDHLLRGR